MSDFINCNLCGSSGPKLLKVLAEPFRLVKCRKCSLIYLNPQPDQGYLNALYPRDYYRDWTIRQEKARVKLWAGRLKDLEEFKRSGKLLDLGCGDGLFLSLAKESGWDVRGCDPSGYACRYAKEKRGIDVFKGKLEEADFPANFFDCVTAWHTLEHLTDPLSTLKEIMRLIKGGGILIVETPNANDYIFQAVYRLVRWKAPELSLAKEGHLFHFSLYTLGAALERAGFRIVNSEIKVSQIRWQKKMIEHLGIIFSKVAGINIGGTIRIAAKKAK